MKIIHILTLVKKFIIENLNYRVVIMLKYQITKNIFGKGHTPN